MSAEDVIVAVDAAVWVAPTGTTAPVDSVSALDPAFKNLGFVSDSGARLAEQIEVVEKRSWTSLYPTDAKPVSRQITVSCALLEFNRRVVEFLYGDVSVNGAQWKLNPFLTSAEFRRSFVLDWTDGVQTFRLYVPVGVVVEVGEVAARRDQAVAVPFAFSSGVGGSPYTLFVHDGSPPQTRTASAAGRARLRSSASGGPLVNVLFLSPKRGKTQRRSQPTTTSRIHLGD